MNGEFFGWSRGQFVFGELAVAMKSVRQGLVFFFAMGGSSAIFDEENTPGDDGHGTYGDGCGQSRGGDFHDWFD